MLQLGRRLDPLNGCHKTRKNYVCMPCREYRALGYDNPHKFSKAARGYILRLPQKWNPNAEEVRREMSPRRRSSSRKKEDYPSTWTSQRENLWETHSERSHPGTMNLPDHATYSRCGEPNPTIVTVYTDGSGTRDRDINAGAWFSHGDPMNRARTNNAGETAAIPAAIQSVPTEQTILK